MNATATITKTPAEPRLYVARAELRLARRGHEALRTVPLNPDPLGAIATAVADIRPDRGEDAQIALDLIPLSPSRVRAHRHRALRAAEQDDHGPRSFSGILGEQMRLAVTTAQGHDHRSPQRTAAPPRRPFTPPSIGKFNSDQPLFVVQLLIRVTARHPGRARSLLQGITASFATFNEANYWHTAGTRIGPIYLGADSRLHRKHFDRRFETGLHAPRRPSVVTTDEIAGLLKPPTKNCAPRNVARSGGLVPAAPHGLPTYTLGARDVLPLGYVTTHDGLTKLAGAYRKEQLFGLVQGKSGYGKSELMLVQMIALSHAGFGTWFLDPHRDGAVRALPYLAHQHLAERLWDVDLTVNQDTDKIGSWNPLSMEGRSRNEISSLVGAVTSSFATTLGWSESHSRAQTILTKSCEALADLAATMNQLHRPDLAPTIFQIPTLLGDEEWRELVVSNLSDEYRKFWERTFPNYPADAIPPVTNAIERLSTSRAIRAFLGQSRSSYDVGRAMNEGKIVFVSPAGSDPVDRLISNMMIFDLFRAGLRRRDIPVTDRKEAWAFLDELTAVDGPGNSVAAIVEQLRKYKVRLMAATQMAERLSATTRAALMQNISIMSTSAGELDAARLVTRQWDEVVEAHTITALPKYHHVISVTHENASTGPFKIRGAEVGALYKPWHRPEDLGKLDRCVDRNLRRRPLGQILAEQDALDEKIARFLSGLQ